MIVFRRRNRFNRTYDQSKYGGFPDSCETGNVG